MHALRRCRLLPRVLAGWLLLWFVLMAGRGIGLPAPGLPEAAIPGTQGQHVHHGSHDVDEVLVPDDQGTPAGTAIAAASVQARAGDAHADHASCPLCMHAAAPAPLHRAQAVTLLPVADPTPARVAARLAVSSAAPPPGRGPPPSS